MKSSLSYSILVFLLGMAGVSTAQQPVYTSPAYTIYPDRVVQGKYTARAISATELKSDYQSPANQFANPLISFKFSINGKDNEMPSGKDHQFYVTARDGKSETPLIAFGHQLRNTSLAATETYLQPGTQLKIRLDMREVLADFKLQGYYTGANGDKIYKNDFKGVFVAGNTAPLIWDFNNLVNHPELELKDADGDGIYETTLAMNQAKDTKSIASSWKMTKDVSAFPQYHSTYPITDALYNLALEEMQNAVEPDSTFRTGKEWGGVWTRDISYSIILSMAVLQPKVAMYSLMRKVKNGRIIQDTGTGGAYPCSSDRMIWAVAAWEVYKVTGDKSWLTRAYQIIKKSVADDVLNVYDTQTGLVRGESSFLDWREQTYPRWMQPADIYESECLGTNVVHYQVNKVLAAMASLLHKVTAVEQYTRAAEKIKRGIQTYLWMDDKGYYGQYLYGRNFKTLSPRSEALGEALSVLFEVAGSEKQQSVISHVPVNAYGIPCIYPQIPGIPPYHNNAVWPFVETYWTMASAKAGNEASVLRGMSAVYRPAALFLTNKENFVASDGDYAGTQINSSNMLWSLSGNIALVYRVLFGMQYEKNSLIFKPFVPKALTGTRTLEHFPYRNALFNISLTGFGNQVSSFILDGTKLQKCIIPADLSGKHTIRIVLANNNVNGKTNLKRDDFAPETPMVSYKPRLLTWPSIPNAATYRVFKNGKLSAIIKGTRFAIPINQYAEYQVTAVDLKNRSSFNSEPINVLPTDAINIVEAETQILKSSLHYQGFSGYGFAEISKTKNKTLNFVTNITENGIYAINFKYANGNGPINTENKCAMRALYIDKRFAGTAVMPQRGKEEWSNWGYSNSIQVKLSKGTHRISLQLKGENENMNGGTNEALIDNIRLIRLSSK